MLCSTPLKIRRKDRNNSLETVRAPAFNLIRLTFGKSVSFKTNLLADFLTQLVSFSVFDVVDHWHKMSMPVPVLSNGVDLLPLGRQENHPQHWSDLEPFQSATALLIYCQFSMATSTMKHWSKNN